MPKQLYLLIFAFAVYGVVVIAEVCLSIVAGGDIIVTTLAFNLFLGIGYLSSFAHIKKQKKSEYYALVALCFIPIVRFFQDVEMIFKYPENIPLYYYFMVGLALAPVLASPVLLKNSVKEFYGIDRRS